MQKKNSKYTSKISVLKNFRPSRSKSVNRGFLFFERDTHLSVCRPRPLRSLHETGDAQSAGAISYGFPQLPTPKTLEVCFINSTERLYARGKPDSNSRCDCLTNFSNWKFFRNCCIDIFNFCYRNIFSEIFVHYS